MRYKTDSDKSPLLECRFHSFRIRVHHFMSGKFYTHTRYSHTRDTFIVYVLRTVKQYAFSTF